MGEIRKGWVRQESFVPNGAIHLTVSLGGDMDYVPVK